LVEHLAFHADDVRSVAFLFSADSQRIMLLERAAWKAFAPGRWTGIGGRLEGEEVRDPAPGALRELHEETGLTLADLRAWRFVADVLDPGAKVRLVYFTAVYPREELPLCTEGMLHWVPLTEYRHYDFIENTRVVLEALLAQGLPDVDDAQFLAALPWRGVIQREDEGQTLRLVLLPPE
jgi:8-oxo-dGTP pyrophosphatase MutT (NUDIX family)